MQVLHLHMHSSFSFAYISRGKADLTAFCCLIFSPSPKLYMLIGAAVPLPICFLFDL